MIERILIHRFRGIRQGDLKDLRKFNVFIGPNNSGKTALLELLYLSATSGRPVQFIRDDLLPAETGALRAATSVRTDLLGCEPLPYLRQRHGKRGEWLDNPAVVTAEGGLEIDLRRLPIDKVAPPWSTFRLGAPLPEWGAEDRFTQDDIARIAMVTLVHPQVLDDSMIPPWIAGAVRPVAPASAESVPQTAGAMIAEQSQSYTATGEATAAQRATLQQAHREAGEQEAERDSAALDWHYLWEPDWVYRWDQRHPLDRLAVWVTQGQRPHPERVLFYNFTTAGAHFTGQFARWAYRTVTDWHEKIAARMADVFPALKDAKIEVLDAPDNQTGRTGYVRFPGRTPLSIDHFGDGARHAFKLLAPLIALAETVDDANPGLVLWEEPEAFMHAATLGRLLNVVIDIVASKPMQVCLTTQSLEVLAWLALYLDEQSAIQPEQVGTFHLNLEDGELRVRPFIGKALGGWLRFFGDPRLIEEEELASPLTRLLSVREERE
ncbi:MAG: AAA family ATPase [Roseiflexus sp.]|nr:AAA family ATPase [Roseiflexus sp.]MDW8147300.1 AAA family ATPase [Roseiflexaceae bacterium]